MIWNLIALFRIYICTLIVYNSEKLNICKMPISKDVLRKMSIEINGQTWPRRYKSVDLKKWSVFFVSYNGHVCQWLVWLDDLSFIIYI